MGTDTPTRHGQLVEVPHDLRTEIAKNRVDVAKETGRLAAEAFNQAFREALLAGEDNAKPERKLDKNGKPVEG